MEQQQFKQIVLDMVHRGGVERLTPATVGYQLGMHAKEVERLLDLLVTDGTLELDSDDDGNMFYFVPGTTAGGVFTGGHVAPRPPESGPKRVPPGSESAARGPSYAPAPGWTPPGYGPPSHGYPAPPQGPGAPQGYPYPPYGGGGAPPPGYPGPAGYPANGARPAWNGQAPRGGAPWQPPGYGPGGPPAQGYPPGPQPPYAMQPYPPHAYPPAVGTGDPALMQRHPATAAALSIFPGAGQLYNGQVGRGMFFFALTTMLYLTGVLFPLGMLSHLWSAADAHRTARRMSASAYGMLPP